MIDYVKTMLDELRRIEASYVESITPEKQLRARTLLDKIQEEIERSQLDQDFDERFIEIKTGEHEETTVAVYMQLSTAKSFDAGKKTHADLRFVTGEGLTADVIAIPLAELKKLHLFIRSNCQEWGVK